MITWPTTPTGTKRRPIRHGTLAFATFLIGGCGTTCSLSITVPRLRADSGATPAIDRRLVARVPSRFTDGPRRPSRGMCRSWDDRLRGDGARGIRDEPASASLCTGHECVAGPGEGLASGNDKGCRALPRGWCVARGASPPSEESLPYRADPTVGRFSAGRSFPGGAPARPGTGRPQISGLYHRAADRASRDSRDVGGGPAPSYRRCS